MDGQDDPEELSLAARIAAVILTFVLVIAVPVLGLPLFLGDTPDAPDHPDASIAFDQTTNTDGSYNVNVTAIDVIRADELHVTAPNQANKTILGGAETVTMTNLQANDTVTVYAVDGTRETEPRVQREVATYTVDPDA